MSKDDLNIRGRVERHTPQEHTTDLFEPYQQLMRRKVAPTLSASHSLAKINQVGRATLLNDLDTPTGQREQHGFSELAAQLGLHGYALVKTDPMMDSPPYLIFGQGVARALETLDEVREYLSKMPVEEPGNG